MATNMATTTYDATQYEYKWQVYDIVLQRWTSKPNILSLTYREAGIINRPKCVTYQGTG